MIPRYWEKPRCQHGYLKSEPCFQCKRDPVRAAKFEADFLAHQKRVPSSPTTPNQE